jgi:hypothetical protein
MAIQNDKERLVRRRLDCIWAACRFHSQYNKRIGATRIQMRWYNDQTSTSKDQMKTLSLGLSDFELNLLLASSMLHCLAMAIEAVCTPLQYTPSSFRESLLSYSNAFNSVTIGGVEKCHCGVGVQIGVFGYLTLLVIRPSLFFHVFHVLLGRTTVLVATPSLHAAPSPSPVPALTGPAELVIPDFAIPRPGNDKVLALLEATPFSPTTMPGASSGPL